MKPLVTLAPTELTMETFRHLQETISLEAFAGSDGLRQAMTRLPQLYTGAKSFYARFAGNLAAFMFKTGDIRDLATDLERCSYVDIRGTLVTVPEGLGVDLLAYTQCLLTSTTMAQNITKDVLAPFEHYLATLLGDPQQLAALTGQLKVPELRLHQLEPAEKKINACFVHSGKREALVPFGRAFHRIADVRTLSGQLEKLEAAFGKDDQKRIIELTRRITEMLGEIITVIEGQSATQRTSPAAVKALSDMSYLVARELEHYGLVRYRLTELSNSIDATMKQIGTWINLQKAK